MSSLITQHQEHVEDDNAPVRIVQETLWQWWRGPYVIWIIIALIFAGLGLITLFAGARTQESKKNITARAIGQTSLVPRVEPPALNKAVHQLYSAWQIAKKEGQVITSANQLVPQYILKVPEIPGLPAGAKGWTFDDRGWVWLSDVSEVFCKSLMGGMVLPSIDEKAGIRCFRAGKSYSIVYRTEELPVTDRGFQVITVVLNATPHGALASLISDGEFRATCPEKAKSEDQGVHAFPVDESWTQSIELCLPIFKGEEFKTNLGTTAVNGSEAFALQQATAGKTRSLFIALNTTSGCSPTSNVVGWKTGMAEGVLAEIATPPGCYPGETIPVQQVNLQSGEDSKNRKR